MKTNYVSGPDERPLYGIPKLIFAIFIGICILLYLILQRRKSKPQSTPIFATKKLCEPLPPVTNSLSLHHYEKKSLSVEKAFVTFSKGPLKEG